MFINGIFPLVLSVLINLMKVVTCTVKNSRMVFEVTTEGTTATE